MRERVHVRGSACAGTGRGQIGCSSIGDSDDLRGLHKDAQQGSLEPHQQLMNAGFRSLAISEGSSGQQPEVDLQTPVRNANDQGYSLSVDDRSTC